MHSPRKCVSKSVTEVFDTIREIWNATDKFYLSQTNSDDATQITDSRTTINSGLLSSLVPDSTWTVSHRIIFCLVLIIMASTTPFIVAVSLLLLPFVIVVSTLLAFPVCVAGLSVFLLLHKRMPNRKAAASHIEEVSNGRCLKSKCEASEDCNGHKSGPNELSRTPIELLHRKVNESFGPLQTPEEFPTNSAYVGPELAHGWPIQSKVSQQPALDCTLISISVLAKALANLFTLIQRPLETTLQTVQKLRPEVHFNMSVEVNMHPIHHQPPPGQLCLQEVVSVGDSGNSLPSPPSPPPPSPTTPSSSFDELGLLTTIVASSLGSAHGHSSSSSDISPVAPSTTTTTTATILPAATTPPSRPKLVDSATSPARIGRDEQRREGAAKRGGGGGLEEEVGESKSPVGSGGKARRRSGSLPGRDMPPMGNSSGTRGGESSGVSEHTTTTAQSSNSARRCLHLGHQQQQQQQQQQQPGGSGSGIGKAKRRNGGAKLVNLVVTRESLKVANSGNGRGAATTAIGPSGCNSPSPLSLATRRKSAPDVAAVDHALFTPPPPPPRLSSVSAPRRCLTAPQSPAHRQRSPQPVGGRSRSGMTRAVTLGRLPRLHRSSTPSSPLTVDGRWMREPRLSLTLGSKAMGVSGGVAEGMKAGMSGGGGMKGMMSMKGKESSRSELRRGEREAGCALRQVMVARGGQFKRLKAMLRSTTRDGVNSPNKHGATALHVAAWVGKGTEALRLVEHGAAIDNQDQNGLTPLHLAVWKNHLSCMSVLLQSGADVNIRAEIKDADTVAYLTPLHFALVRKNKLMAHMLLLACNNNTTSPTFKGPGTMNRIASLSSFEQLGHGSPHSDLEHKQVQCIDKVVDEFVNSLLQEGCVI